MAVRLTLRRRLRSTVEAGGLALVFGVSTWLVSITHSPLSSLLAAALGGGIPSGLPAGFVFVLVVAVLLLGGLSGDGVLGESAVGVGALLAGVGGLLAVSIPGAVTSTLLAICAIIGFGLLTPMLCRRYWQRHGPSRVGAVFGTIVAGHLVMNSLVGTPPRSLAYAAFRSWRVTLLAATVILLGGALAWFAVVGRPTSTALRAHTRPETVRRELPTEMFQHRRAVLLVGGLLVCTAWTVVAAVVIHARVTAATGTPIPGLVLRVFVLPLGIGAVAAGPVIDHLGLRRAGLGGFLGVLVGIVGLFIASGTAVLGLTVLVVGVSTGVLSTVVFVLPRLLPGLAASSFGTVSGIALSVALLTAVLAQSIARAGLAGGPSLPIAVLVMLPALVGIVLLAWLLPRTGPDGTRSVAPHSGDSP